MIYIYIGIHEYLCMRMWYIYHGYNAVATILVYIILYLRIFAAAGGHDTASKFTPRV